jgi:hypothetical protein
MNIFVKTNSGNEVVYMDTEGNFSPDGIDGIGDGFGLDVG